MAEQEKGINNEQRKGLIKLLTDAFYEKDQQARNKTHAVRQVLQEQIETELGAKALKMKIEALEHQIIALKEEHAKVSFKAYTGFHNNAINKADKLMESKIHNSDYSIEIRRIRDEALAGIWTAETLKEAKDLFDKAMKTDPERVVKSIVCLK